VGTSPTGVYRHWFLWALAGMLSFNILLCSWTRVPLDRAHTGTFCVHLGVLILIGGTAWYSINAESGRAIATRTEGGWAEIESFYLERSASVYVGGPICAESSEVPTATPLPLDPSDPTERAMSLDIPLDGCPDGVGARAMEYLPFAQMTYEWSDDCPLPAPAVIIRVEDEQFAARIALCPSYPQTRQFQGTGYTIVHHGDTSPRALECIIDSAAKGASPDTGGDLAIVATGPEIDPTVLVTNAEGQTWKGKLIRDSTLGVPLGGRIVRVTLENVLSRATRVGMARPAPEGAPFELTTAAVRVEITSGEFRRSLWVPFSVGEMCSEMDAQRVHLPGGRWIDLRFAPRARPLATRLEIVDARYEVHPGSLTPKDYLCDVRTPDGRVDTIGLNRPLRVGDYQISQGSWIPSPDAPHQIVFLVSSRPGLGAVWTGCILIAVGLPYSFYVKPLIIRRRHRREAT